MKEQLIQYVELLFAGAKDSEEIKQEILQNTLDRYDDLVAQGKAPEAAYRLAIMGIGDINEIWGTPVIQQPAYQSSQPQSTDDGDTNHKKLLRAIGIALYILCIVPVIVLDELFGWSTLGLCCTLVMVAIATALMILGEKKESKHTREKPEESPLRRSIGSLIWVIALAVYFILSFATRAWFATWLIFPLAGAVKGLCSAILDFLEVN